MSCFVESEQREVLFRKITESPESSYMRGSPLFGEVEQFFGAPQLFAGVEALERRRGSSRLRNDNGPMPLLELYAIPQNNRIWAFVEKARTQQK